MASAPTQRAISGKKRPAPAPYTASAVNGFNPASAPGNADSGAAEAQVSAAAPGAAAPILLALEDADGEDAAAPAPPPKWVQYQLRMS